MITGELINAGIALIVAFVLGALFTKALIPFLKKHQFKQFVREVGPESHLSKTGTPSMGGLAMVGAVAISSLAVGLCTGTFTWGMLMVLATGMLFGLIGFIDDYEKAIMKNNKGISPKQKIIFQLMFSGGFAISAYLLSGVNMASYNFHYLNYSSSVWVPILDKYVDLGIYYIPWVMFVMVAFSNSVNLTDGLDGLASSVTAIVAACMVICGAMAGYLDYPLIYGAIIGACLGFLVYNHFPAKIFMGDTGSMALGGLLASTAIMMKLEIIVAIAGLLYVCEALSVIIQVSYFKATGGKRIFRMAPLHHHFELGGMHETKVVLLFDAVTLGFCLIALLLFI